MHSGPQKQVRAVCTERANWAIIVIVIERVMEREKKERDEQIERERKTQERREGDTRK